MANTARETTATQRIPIWIRLTEPHPGLESLEEQRRARLLAALLLVTIPPLAILELLRNLTAGQLIALSPVMLTLVIAYILSRSQYAAIGAILTMGTFTAFPFLVIITRADYSVISLTNSLILIALTVIAASVVLELRYTAAIIALNGLLMGITVVLVPSIDPESILYPLGFVTIVALLVMTTSIIRYQDICQIEEQAATLSESEARFRSLFEATFEGIVIHQNGIILDSNYAFQTMIGYSLAEIADEALWAFVEEQDRPAMQESVLNRSAIPCQATVRREDGSQLAVEMITKEHTYQNRRVSVTAIRDITERTRSEAEKERLIQDLEAFAHTVAHDLKAPVAIMVGMAGSLEDDYGLVSEDQFKASLATIKKQGYRVDSIINELLLLAGLRRQREIPIKAVSMEVVMMEVQDRMAFHYAEYDADVIEPDAWPRAMGYAPWITEVWVNYINNALKYGGKPPRVELGSTLLSNGMIRFWVRDNGAGMTDEQSSRLFAEFTRLQDNTHTRGHGLGLSIVYSIVEKLKGQVGVESVVGEGSTFWFALPAASVENVNAQSAHGERST